MLVTNKTRVLHIRLTEEEYTSYKNFTDNIGETSSRFTRKLIRETINGEVDLLMDEQSGFKLAIRQLVGMANNLNQLTKAIHTGAVQSSIDSSYLDQIKVLGSLKSEMLCVLHKSNRRWVKDHAV